MSRRPQKRCWCLKHQDQWVDPVSMGTLYTRLLLSWERTTHVCNLLFTLAGLPSGYLQHGPQCTCLSKVPGLVGDFPAWWRMFVKGGVVALLCSLGILARALTCLISRATLKIFTIRGTGETCEVETWTGNFHNVSELLIFIFLLTQSLILRNF